jgi:hypothetical protein
MATYDIEADGLRGLNEALHGLSGTTPNEPWEVVNPGQPRHRGGSRCAARCDREGAPPGTIAAA